MTGRIVALVKPQFEAGRDDVPRGGVVRDPAIWQRVLRTSRAAAAESGCIAHRAIRSPITGGDGNVEFLVDLRGEAATLETRGTESVVAAVARATKQAYIRVPMPQTRQPAYDTRITMVAR